MGNIWQDPRFLTQHAHNSNDIKHWNTMLELQMIDEVSFLVRPNLEMLCNSPICNFTTLNELMIGLCFRSSRARNLRN
jgi:hypothetical protein